MEFAPLLEAFKCAEATMIESGMYSGLTLGQVLRDWPDAIASGKLAKQKCKIVKAYCKFVQSGLELQAAVHGLPSPSKPSTPVMLQLSSPSILTAKNSHAKNLKGQSELLNLLPLARVAAPPVEESSPELAFRMMKLGKLPSKSQGTQTSQEASSWWPPRPRDWPRLAARGIRQPRALMAALVMLVLPKLAFMAFRVFAEYMISFCLAHIYGTMISLSSEATLLTTNLVDRFERWLIYGSGPSAVPPSPAGRAASSPVQTRAAVQAVALAANLSQDVADQMCEAVDLTLAFAGPATAVPGPEPKVGWTDPGMVSIALVTIVAKLWQRL